MTCNCPEVQRMSISSWMLTLPGKVGMGFHHNTMAQLATSNHLHDMMQQPTLLGSAAVRSLCCASVGAALAPC